MFQFLYGSIGSAAILGGQAAYLEFQFLYGSIGSGINSDNELLKKQFQFLYGSIGRVRNFFEELINRYVSIPLWFDWKSPTITVSCGLLSVSIPLWFDWKHGRDIFPTKHQ